MFTFHGIHKSWKYWTSPLPKSWVLRIHIGQGFLFGNNFEWVYKAYISAAGRKKTLPITVELYSAIFGSTSLTVSRWMKEALKLARINVSIFKCHSARVESSSKASTAVFSLEDILARGSWSIADIL